MIYTAFTQSRVNTKKVTNAGSTQQHGPGFTNAYNFHQTSVSVGGDMECEVKGREKGVKRHLHGDLHGCNSWPDEYGSPDGVRNVTLWRLHSDIVDILSGVYIFRVWSGYLYTDI